MHARTDNVTSSRPGPGAPLTDPTADNLVAVWARGRRRITPWAYPYLRGLAAIRFAVGIFLTGLGAVMLAHAEHGYAALPLAGAVLVFSIAYLDFRAARSVSRRS